MGGTKLDEKRAEKCLPPAVWRCTAEIINSRTNGVRRNAGQSGVKSRKRAYRVHNRIRGRRSGLRGRHLAAGVIDCLHAMNGAGLPQRHCMAAVGRRFGISRTSGMSKQQRGGGSYDSPKCQHCNDLAQTVHFFSQHDVNSEIRSGSVTAITYCLQRGCSASERRASCFRRTHSTFSQLTTSKSFDR
jgi:hypothetical protein